MTLANQLTVFRILLIPIFVLLLVYEARIAALIVFLLTCLSDSLDGYVARTWQQQTTLGTYLDPIADKLLMVTTFFTLALLKALPVSLTILLIVRDITLSLFVGFVLFVSGRRLAGPTYLGRAAMFAQMTTVVLGLVFYVFEDQPFFQISRPFVLTPIFIATAVLAVVAGIHYIYELIKLLQGVEQSVEPQLPVQ
jgi:CDP-diacylglycerol--glycerol-3-phosphate 3-phosphatidyltransferase